MHRRERWALALLAAGTVVFLPLALNRFVFAKLAAITLGVLLAATVPARGRLPRTAIAILWAAAIVLLLAALLGSTPLAQLLGRPPRYEGVLGLAVYAGAGVAGSRLLGLGRARGSTAWLLSCLAIAAVAVGFEAALEAAGLRPLASNVARPGSLLGNASDEGAWAVLALGPLAAVALRVRGRLHVAGALGAATALVCSGSRGALVGALAMAAVLVALAPRRGLRLAIAGGCAMIALGVLALPATRGRVLGSARVASDTARGRELLWRETLTLVGDHPLLGVGPSGYLDAVPAYHDQRYELDVGPANPPDSPHDWILQAASAGGVVLALLAVALAALTVRSGLRATRVQATGGEAAAVGGMLAGLVGYGTALLFHLTSPGTTPLAAVFGGALLGGAAVAVPLTTPEPRGAGPLSPLARASHLTTELWRRLHRPLRLATVVALGALFVVLAAAGLAEIPLRSAIDAAATGHFEAANRDFDLARALRPWDGEIAATAAHAYATLATDLIPSAARTGAPWAETELDAYPHSIQALEDAATLDLAVGKPHVAAPILASALRQDPTNPDLQAEAATGALDLHMPAVAVALAHSATTLAPNDPTPWRVLAVAYQAEGQTAQAALATHRAQQLSP